MAILKYAWYGYIYLVAWDLKWIIKVWATKNTKTRFTAIKKIFWKDMRVVWIYWCNFYYRVESDIKYKFVWDYMNIKTMSEFMSIDKLEDVKKEILYLVEKYDNIYEEHYKKIYYVKWDGTAKKENTLCVIKWDKIISRFLKKEQLLNISNFSFDEAEEFMLWKEIWWYRLWYC